MIDFVPPQPSTHFGWIASKVVGDLLKAAPVNGMNSVEDANRLEIDPNPPVRQTAEHIEAVNAVMEKASRCSLASCAYLSLSFRQIGSLRNQAELP